MPSAHSVVVAGMGHAFDPAGHEAICDALEWVLGRAPQRSEISEPLTAPDRDDDGEGDDRASRGGPRVTSP
jgi:hypothetical protein